MRHRLWFCLLAIFCTGSAFAAAIPSPVLTNVDRPAAVGRGELHVLFWHAYDATRFAPEGVWDAGAPHALMLEYHVDLSGSDIADRSIEEMRKQGFADEVKLAAWHSQMRSIFPNVSDGSQLIGAVNAKKESIFYLGDKEIGRVQDPDFARQFFGIWLNEKTSEPQLRKSLLGLR